MSQQLKELLKPPFIQIKERFIGQNLTGPEPPFGYESILAILNTDKFGSEVRDFILAALNEKWERDFGEPIRWIFAPAGDYFDGYICPYCNQTPPIDPSKIMVDCCPWCGKRVKPPEGNNA